MDQEDTLLFLIAQQFRIQRIFKSSMSWMMYCVMAHKYQRRLLSNRTFVCNATRMTYINSIISYNDIECVNQLRMDRRTFAVLCELLRGTGRLKIDGLVSVEEQVCMFLHILAHHVKNRTIHNRFQRSGETVSRYFNSVLCAVLQLHNILLISPDPVPENCTNEKWKWFKVCNRHNNLIILIHFLITNLIYKVYLCIELFRGIRWNFYSSACT